MTIGKKGCDRQQDGDDHAAAHHVAEEADGQRQRARDFADDIERQHDECWFDVGLEITPHALAFDAEHIGTATNTRQASAVVVDNEPVGGS